MKRVCNSSCSFGDVSGLGELDGEQVCGSIGTNTVKPIGVRAAQGFSYLGIQQEESDGSTMIASACGSPS